MLLIRTLVLLIISSHCIFAGFKQVNDISYKGLRTFFPNSDLERISDIDLAAIQNDLRPSFWPQVIPFFAGISHDQRQAFYFQYEFFGFSKINSIQSPNSLIRDVAVTSQGDILLALEQGIQRYTYDFKEEILSKASLFKLNKPYAIDINAKNRLIALSNDGVSVFSLKKDKLSIKSSLSKKINKTIRDDQPIAVAIGPRGHFAVLTEQHLYFFNAFGRLYKQEKNNKQYRHMDVSADSDYIIASPFNNDLDKFSSKGHFLFSKHFNEFKAPIQNFSVYKPFGNVAIFDVHRGLYLTMKTDIDILASSFKDNIINAEFSLYFPSTVNISLLSKDKKLQHSVLSDKNLAADVYQFSWKDVPATFKNGYIQIQATALYSDSNSVKRLQRIQ